MRKLKREGFSLVELLAVIVILGIVTAIAIAATSVLTDKAKETEMDSYKNTIKMSAQTYLQNNKNLVPKVVGETKDIPVTVLKEKNYLTEEIKNKKGESCMANSYVRVYKLSNTEYTYTTYLYCGDDEVPEEEYVPKPKIIAKFTDSSGETENSKLSNVSDAYLFIDISAASDSELQSYKNAGTHIQLDGYSFKIFVEKDGKTQEAYNSGSLSAGREEKLLINKRLKDYIDLTGATKVSVEVHAINTLGGDTKTTKNITQGGIEVDKTKYQDVERPKCVAPTSPYDEEDWINREEYALSKEPRKLTVGCDDGTGSQCIRTYFTESWPNENDTTGAEFVYIKVKDNAGNISCTPDQAGCEIDDSTSCKFRVNVDIQTPSAIVTAHVGRESSSNESKDLVNKFNNPDMLKKSITVNDTFEVNEILPTDEYYKELFGVDSTKWFNNEKYPYGVVYKIQLTDNIRLDKWTWSTNIGLIDDDKDPKYKNVGIGEEYPESTQGMVEQKSANGMTDVHGSTKATVYVRFLTEGRRYGVFKAYDKAGNSIEIKIAANIDRTAPPVPEKTTAYVFDKVRTEGTKPSQTKYNYGTWTNKYVRVQTDKEQNLDNESEGGVTLAGFWQFYYEAKDQENGSVGDGDYSTFDNGIGYYDFQGPASEVDGKNKISFKGCDKANNCSNYGTKMEVWIDISFPVCTVTRTIHGSLSSYGWLGEGESATVTATCDDKIFRKRDSSACVESTFEHLYNYQIETSSAGAKGNSKGGYYTDGAGNRTDCAADKTVKIDYKKPSCSVSGGNSAWTNKSRTITGKCSDTGGSGCVSNISHTYSSNINTTNAGPAGDGNGGTVRDKADNSIGCDHNQTVRVDKDPPYMKFSPTPHQVYENNNGIDVTGTCYDDFSGLSSSTPTEAVLHVKSPSNATAMARCCDDKAGNRKCDSSSGYRVKYYGRHSSCDVESYNSCRSSNCDVEEYNSCRNKDCGVDQYKSCTTFDCGSFYHYVYRGQFYNSANCPKGYMTKSVASMDTYKCAKTCRTSSCGISSYKSCAKPVCGVKRYKICTDEKCGVKYHNKCWSYNKPCCDSAPHPPKL